MKNKNQKEVANDAIYDDLFDRSDLTLEEKKFILYYLESMNATQSYLKAHDGDVTKAQAYVRGSQLLNSDRIQLELRRVKKIFKRVYDIDPTRYIEFQLKGANADIGDYIKFSEDEVPVLAEDGSQMFDPDTGEKLTKKINRMHLVDSDKVDTSVITKIKQGRDGITIELVDKNKCWENLKNFMDWHMQKKKDDENDNSLIEALNARVDDSWAEDEDLDKDWKEYGNKK